MVNTLQPIESRDTELVSVEPTPREKVDQAKEWSSALMNVVNNATDTNGKKTMVSSISGNEFLKLEAWLLIGAFAHIRAETEWTKPFIVNDQIEGFEAKVVLVDMETGEKRGGGATAMCGMDENVAMGQSSLGAKRNAVLSMAQTRATSKAFRLQFSYVAVLGGYSPTPAEEMENFTPKKTGSVSFQSAPKSAPSNDIKFPYVDEKGAKVFGHCQEHGEFFKITVNQNPDRKPSHCIDFDKQLWCEMPDEAPPKATVIDQEVVKKDMTQADFINRVEGQKWRREDVLEGLGESLTDFIKHGGSYTGAWQEMCMAKGRNDLMDALDKEL